MPRIIFKCRYLKNASEFISMAVEQNLDLLGKRKNYVGYIANRPGAKAIGTHGLFTDAGVPVVLSQVAEKVANHIGNVWTNVISLRREDAPRLGYDSAKAWRDLIRGQRNHIAEQMKITPENLRWYAAYHDEGHHPHVHLIAYSADPGEAYVTKEAIQNMRGSLAREIFKQDLLQIYSQQTERRNILTKQSQDTMKEIIRQISAGVCENKTIEDLISHLAERLKHTSGKKQYGYLKAPLKAVIDQIVDELARDERVAKCYAKWHELRDEIIRTYADRLPPPLPLSRQKEFKSIKNMVIAEALNIGGRHFTFEPDETAEASVEEKLQYRLGQMLYTGTGTEKDVPAAVEYFEKAAKLGNQYAQYALGKLYLMGHDVPRDRETAMQWLTASAAQGNICAQFFLDRVDSFLDPSILLAATRLMHHLGNIFRDEHKRIGGSGAQVDRKLRKKLAQKKSAQGHAYDDHAPQQSY